MKLVVATHNPAKFKRYHDLLEGISDLEIVSLTDLHITEKIGEPYETATENALHKVTGYAKLTGLPTLSIDEAARTNFLPENEQPGVYVRRVADRKTELTDLETLEFWKETFTRFPQPGKEVVWDFRIAYSTPDNTIVRISHIEMHANVADTFSGKIIPGYPMSSFLILEGTDKPAADLTVDEKRTVEGIIFKPFVTDFISWIENDK